MISTENNKGSCEIIVSVIESYDKMSEACEMLCHLCVTQVASQPG